MNLVSSTRRWLKQHGAAERSFQRGLLQYFAEQAFAIAEASENFHQLSSDQVSAIFRPEEEHELLMPIVERNIGNLMILGAKAELEAVESRTSSQKTPDDLQGMLIETIAGIPYGVRERIRASVDELARQNYWRKIQDETETNLAKIIQESIDLGETNHALSVRIRNQLGGFEARKRAKKIARTETTMALNAGHEAEREELVAAGLVSGKQWLAITDRDVRSDHSALHNVVVPPRVDFSVGGAMAPYPGHWGLPAGQRVNCRCTTISVFAS